MLHVLIVDDDRRTCVGLSELIAAEGFTTDIACDLREARILMGRKMPQIVVTDLQLPDGHGMDLFEEIGDRPVQIVIITGFACVESALAAWRQGATDYLVKPVCFDRLKQILHRIRDSLTSNSPAPGAQVRRMLGESPAMQTFHEQIRRVAPTDATVFLIGESGTGKELAARSVHDLSSRHEGPFLAVNCGAISPNLIESEMFGHERGSFTGAERQHQGYFERADGGTLFLDEITEMPLELQVKLLRVLETSRFMRVGTNREIATNVRVVAATNREPAAAVAAGTLRADLYHRLNVFPLRLPALRERADDIPLLAQSFLDELNRKYNTNRRFPEAAMPMLCSHSWPGNVRELRNYVQRAYIMADTDSEETALVPIQALTATPGSTTTLRVPVGTSLAEVDRQMIYATLDQCGGVKKRAADVLGISLKTLYNRLESYSSGMTTVLDDMQPEPARRAR